MRPARVAALGLFMALLAISAPAAGATTADGLAQWLEGGRFDIHLRSFYMNRHFDKKGTQEAMALGGWLFYETAPLWNMQLGAAAYTSQGVFFMDNDRTGTNLLSKDQEGYSVLGQLYLKGRLARTTATAFRQTLDTPFINTYDLRMTPITYEAYTLVSQDIADLTVTASWVAAIKPWTETTFIPMSQKAGARGGDDGVAMLGLQYRPTPDWDLQLWNYYANQVLNITYLQADHGWKLPAGWGLVASLQGLDQRDVGDAQAGRYDVWQGGARLKFSHGGLSLIAAFTLTGPDQAVCNPWSGFPGFTSIMEEDNDRADDRTWLLGLVNEFGPLGPGELKVNLLYTNSSTPDSGKSASPDQWEADLNIDYTFKKTALNGLWLRLRAATVDQDEAVGGQDYADLRFIVNYEFNLLK